MERDDSEPFELIVEMARAENSGDPFAFRFAPQAYILRQEDGSSEGATFPWSQAVLEELAGLARPRPDPELRQRLGDRLRAFLAEGAWKRQERAILAAHRDGRSIRITVRASAAELYALPWELLTLGPTGQHLGALRRALVRYEWPGTETEKPDSVTPPEGGRVLFAWSAGGGGVPAQAHLEALRKACREGGVPFDPGRDVVGKASAGRLRAALAATPTAVLHILCHGGKGPSGGETYGLVLDGAEPDDPAEVLDAGALRQLLAPHAGVLRLVVLCACYGGQGGALDNHLGSVAQALHRVGIPAVVASRFPLSVPGSITLTEILYRQLLVGSASLEEAFLAARATLAEEAGGGLDWASLQLYAREGDGPDHRPFVLRPYRGLRPFAPEDRRFHLGRREDVSRLLAVISGGQRLLTVVGGSGSGKSSVVMAGLVPAIVEGALGGSAFQARIMRPGGGPCRALSAALRTLSGGADSTWRRSTLSDADLDVREALLARSDALHTIVEERLGEGPDAPRLLLVVDQLEELVNLTTDRADAEAFVANLLDAIARPEGRVVAVLTLRADFLGKCVELGRGMAEQLEASIRILMPMSEAQMQEVIERPAAMVGLRFEPGVVEALLSALREGASPAASNLPLLAFALEGLWERRRGNRIPWSAWQALGGLSGAVAKRADEVLDEAAGDLARRLVRDIFGRLVQLGEGAADTRRYATRAELESLAPGMAGKELDRWISARLLSSDGEEVAVAHEAVIRAWSTLRGWIAEDREALLVRQELRGGALPWREGGRHADDLWRGGRLKRATELRDLGRLRLSEGEAEFLAAAEAAQRAEVEAEASRMAAELARERKARRRVRAVAIGAVGVAVAMAGLTVWARNEQVKAAAAEANARQSEAAEAQQRLLARQSQILAGARELLATRQPALAMKLLLEVEHPDQRPEWAHVALDTLDDRVPLVTLQGHTGGVDLAAWSPDGERVVTASEDRTAWVWSADGKGPRVILAGHRGALLDAAWSPDGKLVATASEDKSARVWNADGSGEPVCLVAHEGPVLHVAWSPEGKRLATASADGTARIWRTDGDGPSILLGGHGARDGHDAEVRWIAWSRDGQRVVTASADRTARVWNADGSGSPVILAGHRGGLLYAELDAAGTRVVTSSEDGTARVWSADGKGEPRVLARHQGPVYTASFSPDGASVITASVDRTARVWPAHGDPILLAGHSGYLRSAAWSPDGRRVLTASWDDTARVWSADGSGTPMELLGHRGYLMSAAWSGDGKRVVTASLDGTAVVWDVAESEDHFTSLGHTDTVWSAAWSPDGKRILTTAGDQTARIWNADGSGTPLVFPRVGGYLHFAAWSPDGKRVITASWDKTATIWNADGTPTGVVLRERSGALNAAVFSPDGKVVATASTDRFVRLWNADGTGEPRILRGHDGRVTSAAWSPDGKRLVTTSNDRSARVWTLDGSAETVVLLGHDRGVTSAAWSPDGKRIVTGSNDRTVRIWNADGSAGDRLLGAHGKPVTSVSWSPDGAWIASASEDHTVQVWGADVEAKPLSFHGHRDTVQTVAWSPDGKRVVTASADKTARVWDFARTRALAERGTETLRERLRQVNHDCLPAELRRKYLDETKEESVARYTQCEVEEGRPATAPKPGGGGGGACSKL